MRIIAKKILREFWDVHGDSKQQLNIWYREVQKMSLNSPHEVKSYFPRASILKEGRVVFDICGNKYRLVVKINYERGWVFIRFIGRHSDYNNIDAQHI